ncbi:MAG: hypothetical protein QM811_07670 [Pirellulales bacterium]
MNERDFLRKLASRTHVNPPRNLNGPGDANPVGEKISLAGKTFSEPVTLENYVFNEHCDFSRCVFEKGLTILGCVFRKGLRLTDTTVEKNLRIDNCELGVPPNGFQDWRRLKIYGVFSCTRLVAKCGVNLSDLYARYSVVMDYIDIDVTECPYTANVARYEMQGVGLKFLGAVIEKSLFIRSDNDLRSKCIGQLDLRAKIQDSVILGLKVDIRKIAGVEGRAVRLEDATIGGNVLLGAAVTDPRPVSMICYGAMDFQRVRIGGDLRFEAGFFDLSSNGIDQVFVKGNCIDLLDVRVEKSIFFNYVVLENAAIPRLRRAICRGKIDLRAQIGGALQFEGTHIDVRKVPAAGGFAVNLTSAVIGQQVLFYCASYENRKSRFRCYGQIDLRATVGNSVEFHGCLMDVRKTPGASGLAVDLKGAPYARM